MGGARAKGAHVSLRSTRRITLLMQPWAGYLQNVRFGIGEYFIQRPNWLWKEFWPSLVDPSEVAQIEGDGVIAFVQAWYAPQVAALKMPVVDVSNWVADMRLPRVLPDDAAIGAMAADYLLGLGLRNFAYFGIAGVPFGDLRFGGYERVLSAAGFKVELLQPGQGPLTFDRQLPAWINPGVYQWLRQLPKPVGLFAINDSMALGVLEICRHTGLAVPDEICVLGVDDDELVTRISHPPLSSIAIHGRKIGFEAARLLDELMSGGSRPTEPILLPPVGITARQSTNLLAIGDADVAAALRHIREHVHERLSVRDVLRAVPVNRRYLERKFKQLVGRSPLQEISRSRLEQAKQLLSGTELSIPTVARRSGFRSAERMASVFRKMTGQTPSRYRRAFRLDDRL